jgi:hypothetical protein
MNTKAMTSRSGLLLGLAFISTLLGVSVCQASSITYDVNQAVGTGSAIGTITTDGHSGVLGVSDITAWNLELSVPVAFPGPYSFDLTNLISGNYSFGSDLTATPTDLYFNFSGPSGMFLLQVVYSSGQFYYCDQSSGGACLNGASVAPLAYGGPGFQNAAESGNQIIGVAATPLPSTWTMLIAGFVGLFGFVAFGGKKRNAAATAA